MDPLKFVKQIKRPSAFQLVVWGIGILFAIGLFLFTKNFTACWTLTSLPGRAPQTCGTSGNNPNIQPNASGSPAPVGADGTALPVDNSPTLSAPMLALPPAWDGATRVTVLIHWLGLPGLGGRFWGASF
jgi:hypothetical protein